MSHSKLTLASEADRTPVLCPDHPIAALPVERLERLETWGMNASCLSYVYRPSRSEDVRTVFATARSHGRTVCIRGGGRSYGDASLASEEISLDLSRMNRIMDWDPLSGLITVEPGVTLRQLWQYVIGDGWWPPVVSGTMHVTMGGAAAMNYHGKNNYLAGPIGEHIREFDLMTPTGDLLTCTPVQNADLFFAAVGGFGMLGCFTRLTLQMKRVYSGLLEVEAFATRNFRDIIEQFEQRKQRADYLVGWIDCFVHGKHIGRGLVHSARYLRPGEDPSPAQTLRLEKQELPDTLFGVIPKSIMWLLLKPFAHNTGMKLINAAKYFSGSTFGNHQTTRQSHAGFAFLLDYVPNWKWAYRPGGLIQYQSFVPIENTERCFTRQIEICQAAGMVPWLGVFKRHRPDAFLMSHAVDGYSLALDFPVTKWNRQRLWALTSELNQIVLANGGRFYFAKDSTLDPVTARAYLGEKTLRKFGALKRQFDPEGLLQTDLSKRLFDNFQEFGKAL